MMDKVQKIKEWISKEQDGLMNAQGNFEYPEHEGAYHILCNLDAYIDSLQEEPVSEELKEAALLHLSKYYDTSIIWDEDKKCVVRDFKAGAEWQKEQMMAKAIDAKLLEGHLIRQKGVTHPLHVGDKVKVIVIKED